MAKAGVHKKKRHRFKRNYKQAVKQQLTRQFFLITKKDLEEIVTTLPKLSKEDHLFSKDGKGIQPYGEMIEYGYANCALYLMNCILLSKDKLVACTYIYPTLFCFRHYIELAIKTILTYYGEEDIPNIHNLLVLMEKLSVHIGRDEEIKNIIRLLTELTDIDTNSTAFRYPELINSHTKNVKQSPAIPRIDVEVLRERLFQIYRFFDGILEEARCNQYTMAENAYY